MVKGVREKLQVEKHPQKRFTQMFRVFISIEAGLIRGNLE